MLFSVSDLISHSFAWLIAATLSPDLPAALRNVCISGLSGLGASFRRLGRIGQRPVRLLRDSLRQARWHDSFRPKNMKYPVASYEQVVRDDPAVAPPPHYLRAHHGAGPNAA